MGLSKQYDSVTVAMTVGLSLSFTNLFVNLKSRIDNQDHWNHLPFTKKKSFLLPNWQHRSILCASVCEGQISQTVWGPQ